MRIWQNIVVALVLAGCGESITTRIDLDPPDTTRTVVVALEHGPVFDVFALEWPPVDEVPLGLPAVQDLDESEEAVAYAIYYENPPEDLGILLGVLHEGTGGPLPLRDPRWPTTIQTRTLQRDGALTEWKTVGNTADVPRLRDFSSPDILPVSPCPTVEAEAVELPPFERVLDVVPLTEGLGLVVTGELIQTATSGEKYPYFHPPVVPAPHPRSRLFVVDQEATFEEIDPELPPQHVVLAAHYFDDELWLATCEEDGQNASLWAGAIGGGFRRVAPNPDADRCFYQITDSGGFIYALTVFGDVTRYDPGTDAWEMMARSDRTELAPYPFEPSLCSGHRRAITRRRLPLGEILPWQGGVFAQDPVMEVQYTENKPPPPNWDDPAAGELGRDWLVAPQQIRHIAVTPTSSKVFDPLLLEGTDFDSGKFKLRLVPTVAGPTVAITGNTINSFFSANPEEGRFSRLAETNQYQHIFVFAAYQAGLIGVGKFGFVAVYNPAAGNNPWCPATGSVVGPLVQTDKEGTEPESMFMAPIGTNTFVVAGRQVVRDDATSVCTPSDGFVQVLRAQPRRQ